MFLLSDVSEVVVGATTAIAMQIHERCALMVVKLNDAIEFSGGFSMNIPT